MGALTRYCQTDFKNKIIVSDCPEAAQLAKAILLENGLSGRDDIAACHSSAVIVENPETTVIIVFERVLQSALATSKRLNHFKDQGVPVVFGNARDVFFERPNVSAQGISYPGMFQLCHNYLQGMKALDKSVLAYAEFGVFDGRTCSLAWQVFRDLLGHFYAFDSFRGILGKAEGEESFYETGDYYANKETFRLNLSLCGAEPERFSLVKGDFDKDLKYQDVKSTIKHKLAVVHVDCDVYPAALNVLEFVTPQLADGCLLLFDDYDSMWGDSNKGEKRALKEWTSHHPEFEVSEYRRYSATGRAFLCYRK